MNENPKRKTTWMKYINSRHVIYKGIEYLYGNGYWFYAKSKKLSDLSSNELNKVFRGN